MKFDGLANLQTRPERHRPQSRVNADLPEVGTCVGRRRSRLSTGRYHPPILARLRQAAGIRKKSSSTLQCKLLEYCAWKQCASKSRSFFGALSGQYGPVVLFVVFPMGEKRPVSSGFSSTSAAWRVESLGWELEESVRGV
jgi:hypothetical protein